MTHALAVEEPTQLFSHFVGFRWNVAIAGMLLTAVISGCEQTATAVSEADAGEETADGEAAVTVRVVAAERRNIDVTVAGLGRCDALPEHRATLSAAVEGPVAELLVQQGEHVTAGQPVVNLDCTFAQADLAEKQATRDSLEAALTLLKSLPRQREQDISKLAIEDARIAVARAQAVVDRLKGLRARNEVSEQQLFEAEQALLQAQAKQDTAQAQYDVSMLGPRQEAVDEGQAKVSIAEEAVALAQARFDFHTIKSPIDGILDSLTCHPGQYLSVGAPVGEVVDIERVYVTVWLPIRRAELVRVGQTAEISQESDEPATLNTDTASLSGQVVFVGRVADLQSGNLPVRVLVDNSAGRLSVGQILNMTIIVDEQPDTLCVPLLAIYDEGEGPLLNVVREGQSVVLQPTLGAVRDGWVAVSGTDLAAGEPVIVEGGYNLPEGTPVNTEPADTATGSQPPADEVTTDATETDAAP